MGEVSTNFVAKIIVIGKGLFIHMGSPNFRNVLAAQDRGSLYSTVKAHEIHYQITSGNQPVSPG